MAAGGAAATSAAAPPRSQSAELQAPSLPMPIGRRPLAGSARTARLCRSGHRPSTAGSGAQQAEGGRAAAPPPTPSLGTPPAAPPPPQSALGLHTSALGADASREQRWEAFQSQLHRRRPRPTSAPAGAAPGWGPRLGGESTEAQPSRAQRHPCTSAPATPRAGAPPRPRSAAPAGPAALPRQTSPTPAEGQAASPRQPAPTPAERRPLPAPQGGGRTAAPTCRGGQLGEGQASAPSAPARPATAGRAPARPTEAAPLGLRLPKEYARRSRPTTARRGCSKHANVGRPRPRSPPASARGGAGPAAEALLSACSSRMPGHLAEAARTGCKLDVDPQASLRPLVGSSRGCAAELHLREWLSWMGGSETAAADGGHQLALASTSQDLLSPRKPSPGGPGCAGQASSTAGGEEGLRHGPRDGTAARFGQASGPGPGPRKVARLSFLGNGHAAGALARKGHQGQRRATISSPRENVESRDDAYTSISKIAGTRAMEMLRGEPNRTLAPKTMRFKALAEVVEAAMASHRAGQLGNTVLAKRGSHSRRNSIGAPKRRNSTDARLLAPRIEEDALGNLVVRRRASDVRTFLEDPDELFDQFQHDKEMHRDKLQMALERAGVLCVRREWIDEIFEGITKYTVLDREEFEDFVERYQSRVYQEYETAFANCDFKNSRQVPVTSFSNILAFLGVTVTDAVIKDTAKEVDQGNLGQIDMQQLEQFMAMLCLQQGFSKREYTRIMNAFSHFDLDRSSSLDTSEIAEILSYLNYAILPDNIANIVKEMGAEEDSQLSRSEFLVFMRKVREFEVTKISECLARPDAPTSKLELLQFAMRSLNYVADLDVIWRWQKRLGYACLAMRTRILIGARPRLFPRHLQPEADPQDLPMAQPPSSKAMA
ncbi:unnamed protein product [Prorocentrum cordatum]|uniref:EF-hand domain-containing protein n=1 Tax=Prorocentrum cordatum TaxID=2364126 RepID=A0ABN9QJA3_9DINO|nr:unnamed protein product [Polarella glacialis]